MGTLHILNAVALPDIWNMPLPTRPADFALSACCASLNDAGVGFCVAEGRGVMLALVFHWCL